MVPNVRFDMRAIFDCKMDQVLEIETRLGKREVDGVSMADDAIPLNLNQDGSLCRERPGHAFDEGGGARKKPIDGHVPRVGAAHSANPFEAGGWIRSM